MKQNLAIATALSFLLILSSCATKQGTEYNMIEISSFSGNKILQIEPLFLHEILGITSDREIAEKNLFIGNIEYSGGVVSNPEKGMMLQTKQVAYDRQQSYREKALLSLAKQLRDVTREKDYNVLFWGREELQNIPKEYGDITFTLDYREHKEDGKDNINLPWYQFSINSLSPSITSFFSDPTGARYLMVPVIEHYYSHSAGWFNDQWAGCGAGIRITYHILVFDLSNGRKVFHFSDTEKYLEEFSSRISEFLLMQQFTKIEERISKTLTKKLPKR